MLLEVRNVDHYFGGLCALKEVNFAVERYEIVGLIGPNGAGKTTLFNVISGLYTPQRGKVKFKGGEIAGLKMHEIAARGLVRTWQASALLMDETVERNVSAALYLSSRGRAWSTFFGTRPARDKEERLFKEAQDIINFLGLGEHRWQFARNLPHGPQRKLGMAIALAAKPELLMLDEPATGMTPEETVEMMDIILRLRDQLGITILLVEHNMMAVMGICKRILVLNNGQQIAEGSPEEVQRDPAVLKAYLGVEQNAT